MAKSLVIVDPRVHDFTTLLTELDTDAEVLILDESLDGIVQIAAYLEDREDLDAIHILSHGTEGTLYLGTTVLTSSTR